MRENALLLNGEQLSVSDIVQVAREMRPVELDTDAMKRVQNARRITMELIDSPQQIYGLNTGVGANKDNRITPEQFNAFNTAIICSHSVALPPYAEREVVRATMLCRANGLLLGYAGVQPEMVTLLRDLLNCGIHPRIPVRGSVGMSDLGNMAYLGMTMIGRGSVEYQGEIISAQQALLKCGLEPLMLGPKDGLAIVSSNSFSLGQAALLCYDMEQLLSTADLLYALEYEALNMNPTFLDSRAAETRPMRGQRESLAQVRGYLRGSRLWDSENHTLYGSISFKSSVSIHGAVRDSLHSLEQSLGEYLNVTDDCPVVLQDSHEIISSDNFIITGLAIQFEMMNIALGHLSRNIAYRLLRLDQEEFSGLPRFLRPDQDVICYATMQKTVSALDGEITHLALPASLNYLPTSNESEDHGCNTPYVLGKTRKILDLLDYMLAIDALHGAQAADVSGRTPTGAGTRWVYDKIRARIPMLKRDDRDLGADISDIYELIKQNEFLYGECGQKW